MSPGRHSTRRSRYWRGSHRTHFHPTHPRCPTHFHPKSARCSTHSHPRDRTRNRKPTSCFFFSKNPCFSPRVMGFFSRERHFSTRNARLCGDSRKQGALDPPSFAQHPCEVRSGRPESLSPSCPGAPRRSCFSATSSTTLSVRTASARRPLRETTTGRVRLGHSSIFRFFCNRRFFFRDLLVIQECSHYPQADHWFRRSP
jgi:hypothetical protein